MKPNKMLRLIFAIAVLVILWNIGIIVLDEFNKISNSIQENYSTQRIYSEKRTISKRTTKVVTSSAIEVKGIQFFKELNPTRPAIMKAEEWIALEKQFKQKAPKLTLEELKVKLQSENKADETPEIATQSAFKIYKMSEPTSPSAIKMEEKPDAKSQSGIEVDEKLPVKGNKKGRNKKKVMKKSKKKFKLTKKYIGRANWVNFRTAPNLESEIKEVLKRGTELKIISRKKNWSKVQIESGEKGYVYNKYLTKNKEEFVVEKKKYFGGVELKYSDTYNVSDNPLNRRNGVVYYNGHRETYYSQRVLPGGGLNIPGRHVAEDGTIRDKDGYICVSADLSFLSRGSLLMITLGPAKVYDTGCAYGTIDVYVNW